MNRRTIGIASAIYAASILLSRLIGLVREAVIGRTLGGGSSADVYWTAFVLPDFLNYLLAGGVLSIVFIPIFSGYLTRKEEAEGWRVFFDYRKWTNADAHRLDDRTLVCRALVIPAYCTRDGCRPT